MEEINFQTTKIAKSLADKQDQVIKNMIAAGLDIEYIAAHYTIIKGPMNVRPLEYTGNDKQLIYVSQFWELCPNEKLQERLKELENRGFLE